MIFKQDKLKHLLAGGGYTRVLGLSCNSSRRGYSIHGDKIVLGG